MPKIERLVTPFQTRDVTPPRLTTGAGLTRSNAPVWNYFGFVGRGAMLTSQYQTQTQFYVKHKQKEETS